MSASVVAARDWWNRGHAARFPLRFLLLAFVAVRLSAKIDAWWPAVTEGTARMVIGLCHLVGLPAAIGSSPKAFGVPLASQSSKTIIFGNGAFSYQIIGECTALLLFGIFAAAVLAYPATWRQRTVALFAGAPAVLVLNLVRLLTLAWVGIHRPGLFDQVHVFWWQAFNIFVVGLGWFVWVRLVVHAEEQEAVGPRRLREVLSAVTIFAAVVAAFGVVGVVAHGTAAYGHLLGGVVHPALRALVGAPGVTISRLVVRNVVWLYTSLAASCALFMATSRIPMRARLHGVVTVAIPIVYGFQVLAVIVGTWLGIALHVNRAGVDGMLRILLAANLTIPVAAWYAWNRNTWHGTIRPDEPSRTPMVNGTPEGPTTRMKAFRFRSRD